MMNGLIQHNLENELPHGLTWMKDSRPGNFTLGAKTCVRFNVQVENRKVLHLKLNNLEKRTYEK